MMVRFERRGGRGMMSGLLLALTALPTMAAQNAAVIQLATEPGHEIGIACRFLDPDQRPVPPEAETLCAAAADLVAGKAAGHGKVVVRLGLRAVAPDDGEAEETPPAVDGPILLLVLEGRQDWGGTAHPRLLLRARPIRDGMAAPSVGLPPVSVELGAENWRAAAGLALERVVGFAIRGS